MGIRGLTNFIEKLVPNGFQPVSMKEEIEKFIKENDKAPIIVIDYKNLYIFPISDRKECLYGGQFQQYTAIYENLFKNLREFGAKLVFFKDGPTQEVKTDTWVRNQEETFKNYLMAVNKVAEGCSVAEVFESVEEIPRLKAIKGVLSELAKKYGEVHVSIERECDLEMAKYAYENKALAILANDSDFLIFPGKWRYWSALDIDHTDYSTTMEYNKGALRESLDLPADKMPLFASLCGNDIVQFAELKQFHNRIGFQGRFQKIASFVRSTPPRMGKYHIMTVAEKIFQDKMIDEHTQAILQSLESYDINYKPRPISEDSELLQELLKKGNSKCYIALKGAGAFKIFAEYHDFDRHDFPYIVDLFVLIQKRLFGILLQHLNDRSLTRPLRWKPSAAEPYQVFEVTPEYPPFPVPPLDKLLLAENGEELLETRFKLLFWAISPQLDQKLFQSANPKYMRALLVIYVFHQTGLFLTEELDFLLLTVDATLNNQVEGNPAFPETLDYRIFKVAHLFIQLYDHLGSPFSYVGLKKLSSSICCFDGVYLHLLSSKWPTLTDEERRSKLETIKQFRFYAE